jgi:hypothetical protein
MADIIQFIDERLSNSITAINPPANPIDVLQPLTFTDWLQYNTQLFTTTNDFLNRYQSYLNNWYTAKGVTIEAASIGVQGYYNNIIREIAINYTTDDEKRYLENLDLTNSRDVAIAIPFYSQKLKEICIYYSTLRDDVQTATIQSNLKGSNTGIENLLYVNIVKSLQTQDLVPQFNTLNLNLSTISNNMSIDIEDLYDTYADYYDISPTLPASAYNVSSGLRNDYFSANQFEFDPYLDLNINQSILKAILSYPFYPLELGANNFTIDPLVNSSQLNLLKDSDFISTVNDNTVTNLNLQNQALELSKYMGVDYYYIVTSTTNAYTSGVLFQANSDFANVLNKRYPTVAEIPSQEFLKTAKEVGLFFKPDKIGLSNFTNFNFTPSVDLNKLQPNSVYYFPDPSKYGNISGNSKLQFESPVVFFENNYFNKIDYSNQFRMGDVATDPYYQTFRAYQSREQTLNYTNHGVTRYMDSQDFFNGNIDTMWSNVDVYPLISVSQFPIDERISTLLPIDKTLFQYKSDVYGNEYGLYKSPVNKQFSIVPNNKGNIDLVFDGYVFNLSATDSTFTSWSNASTTAIANYNVLGLSAYYSGVTIRTSQSESIASDGNTPVIGAPVAYQGVALTPVSTYNGATVNSISITTQYILDDSGSFNDGGNAIIVESYDFTINDNFPTLASSYTYSCTIRDGETFTRADGTLLPDSPSDNASFNINSAYLYYNTLADGAAFPGAVNGVATFSYPADFTINQQGQLDTDDYDGSVFWDTTLSIDPCGVTGIYDALTYTYSYTEPSNFVNTRLTNRNTTLDNSLSGINAIKKSMYYTRNIEYGDFYFRNANSTIVGPVSSTLSATFLNYPQPVVNELFNNVINFDVYYDTLQIETDHYLVFDKIEYDYQTNSVVGSVKVLDTIQRGSTDLEKFSTVWFDENTNILMVCVTTLLPSMSASNYKVIYPTIYTINLNTRQTNQVYPTVSTSNLTFNSLSAFSLFGTGLELNIVEVEKPILNYSKDTGYYTLTYLAKDTANCFYIVTTRYQYVNNTVQNITCTLHKPSTSVYNITFGNPQGSPYLETNTVLGSAGFGYVNTSDNTFTWGQP